MSTTYAALQVSICFSVLYVVGDMSIFRGGFDIMPEFVEK
jgi:hypothetical protein